MTFEEWFMSIECGDEVNWHDVVWEDGPHKARDVAKWLEIAFEAGFNSSSELFDNFNYDEVFSHEDSSS